MWAINVRTYCGEYWSEFTVSYRQGAQELWSLLGAGFINGLSCLNLEDRTFTPQDFEICVTLSVTFI